MCTCDEDVAALRVELAHWKANHDNAVRIKRAVLDRPDLADQSRSVQALMDHVERLSGCLAFFASVIKSGERWTETCQAEYDKARMR